MLTKLNTKTHGCYIRYDGRDGLVHLGNEYIEINLLCHPEKGLAVTSLQRPGSEYQWVNGETPAYLYAGETDEIVEFNPLVTQPGKGILRLELKILSPQKPYLVSYWFECQPGVPVIRCWKSLKGHKGTLPINIQSQPSIQLSFLNDPALTLQTIQGIRQDLLQKKEGDYPSYKVNRRELALKDSTPIEFYSGERSSEKLLPWLTLENTWQGETFFMGLEWSGEWSAKLEPHNNGFNLGVGLARLIHSLSKNETFVFPAVFIGLAEGDFESATHQSYKFIGRYITPQPPSGFPWVMANTRESYPLQFTEAELKSEVDAASQIRCEGFYLDTGWQAGSLLSKNPAPMDKYRGLGNWQENLEKFPSGLKAFADYVHAKGLKFGLCIEPGRVDINTANTPEAGWSDKMLAKQGDTVIGHQFSDSFATAQVCLGCAETREWMIETVSRVIREYKVDWLRWDHNFTGICTRDDHGHQQGDGSYSHIMGLYQVLAAIRKSFPKLVIETSAAGGNRLDFGILRYTHTAWLHENNTPHYLVRFHQAGTGLALPYNYRNSWIVENGDFEPMEEFNEHTFAAYLRSRMLGTLGFSLKMKDYPDELKAAFRHEIETYKKFRPCFSYPFYQLTPQQDLRFPALPEPVTWEAYQFFDKSERLGVIFCFRNNSPDEEAIIQLKGLKPHCQYELKDMDTGAKYLQPGNELLEDGFQFKLPFLHASGLYQIKEK
jgi:alpha-galactosidase